MAVYVKQKPVTRPEKPNARTANPYMLKLLQKHSGGSRRTRTRLLNKC
jgi:hypothetical protein